MSIGTNTSKLSKESTPEYDCSIRLRRRSFESAASDYLVSAGWYANPKKAIIAPINSPARPVTNAAKLPSALLVIPANTMYISTNATMKITVPAKATAVFKFSRAIENSRV